MTFFATSVNAQSLTQSQIQAQDQVLQQHILYYNPTIGNGCAATSSTTSSTTALATGSSVYILGDSITERAASAYESTLKQDGITANIDASVSRSLNGAGIDGNKLSGMQAIAQDTAQIKAAGAIVVALGTNGGDTNSSIDQAIAAIRADNPTAPIYWVDIISVGRTDGYNQSVIGPGNQAIYSQATSQNYQVISWFKTVDPSGNPQSPSGAEVDPNGYIDNSDHLGVHPTPAGITALVNLVAGSITGATAASPTGTATCACTSSSSTTTGTTTDTTLVGSDNVQKAYNYFVSKGLTPVQAAGVVGNLMQESGVDPTRSQKGGDSQNPYDAGSLGWGIAQWSGNAGPTSTGDKVTAIYKQSGATGVVYDLATQLDMVWWEMNNTSPTGAQDMVKALEAITDVDKAAENFEQYFEEGPVAASGGGQLANRQHYAEQVLTQYGGSTVAPTGTTVSSTGGCTPSNGAGGTADCSGTVTGNARIACDVLQYDPLSYSQAWHSNGSTFHARCPVIGPSCATDCSGLVSIAIYDVFGNDGTWSTFTMVSDTKNFEIIQFSQLQPGDFIEPDTDHVEVVESVQGNTINTFGADTEQRPQPQQVEAGQYTNSPGYVYLRYHGQGSGS